MTHKDPSFSIYEFRYWLEKQPKSELKFPNIHRPHSNASDGEIGIKVESRLGIQRLEVEILKHNESMKNVADVAKCFKEVGGTIIEHKSDLMIFVETTAGSFDIPKMYTKPSS